MRRYFGLDIVSVAFTGVLIVAAGALQPDKPSDQDLIQGEWEIATVTAAGKDSAERRGWLCTFSADTLTMRPKDAQQGLTLKYKLDPLQDPKEIDTTHELDAGKPIEQLGIYALERDTLTLCLEAAGKPRPTAFASKPADTRHLLLLKRVQKEANTP